MKKQILLLLTLAKLALAQPTGDVIEIPVGKSMEDIMKNYSLFVGTVLSLIVIVFIAIMIRIYRKRRKEKPKKKLSKKRK